MTQWRVTVYAFTLVFTLHVVIINVVGLGRQSVLMSGSSRRRIRRRRTKVNVSFLVQLRWLTGPPLISNLWLWLTPEPYGIPKDRNYCMSWRVLLKKETMFRQLMGSFLSFRKPCGVALYQRFKMIQGMWDGVLNKETCMSHIPDHLTFGRP